MTPDNNSSDVLKMTFDPNTIEHLGVRMYSTLPPVIAELVANSYDAKAKKVSIQLKDIKEQKEIIVLDDGEGMSHNEINEKFLRIGRNRRKEELQQSPENTRKVIGKKGLGKLSFFGISHEIEISTKKSGLENSFIMSWEGIKNSPTPEYQPIRIKTNTPCTESEHGTMITLRKIQRETDFNAEELTNSLSRIFIVDPEFKVEVQHNSEKPLLVENERKYVGLDKQVEWQVPKEVQIPGDYERKEQIRGQLIATKKPISPKTNMRGITLFSRKKLVNLPEYFSDSTSSHFFSYLTGWLEVDFIDDFEEDVISTARQSLNWDHPEMIALRKYLQSMLRWLEQDWRIKRNEIRENELSKSTGINISDWFNKLPDDIRKNVEPIVQTIMKDSELPQETNQETVKKVHEIVPEYPYYHWRHLHPEIQKVSEKEYADKNYFEATERAAKTYILKVKDKACVDDPQDSNNMDLAFNVHSGRLLVTPCTTTTEKTIQNGQQFLSKGIVAGCRNPLDHSFPEYRERLVETGLFTDSDCLDMLSLVSHLFRRLESAKKKTVEVEMPKRKS